MGHPFAKRGYSSGKRRVDKILKAGGGSVGSDQSPFSSAGVMGMKRGTSATKPEVKAEGAKSRSRFARGGKTKAPHVTNIAIHLPPHQPGLTPPGMMAGATGGPPGAIGGPPPMPPGLPPGMPMRKSGGRIKKADGGDTGGMSDVQPVQITPQIRARMERRLQDAEGDEEVQRVIKDAARYGVDWSEHGRKRGGRLPTAGAADGVGRLQKARR
jgi:hypothetical protein